MTKEKKIKPYALVDGKTGKTLKSFNTLPDLIEGALGCKGFADCFRDKKPIKQRKDK